MAMDRNKAHLLERAKVLCGKCARPLPDRAVVLGVLHRAMQQMTLERDLDHALEQDATVEVWAGRAGQLASAIGKAAQLLLMCERCATEAQAEARKKLTEDQHDT